MRWKDKSESEIPLFTTQFPRLSDRLDASPEKRASFWFILEEDKFDALLGDQLYQYFQGAVFDAEASAQAYADERNEESRKDEAAGEEFGVLYVVKSFEARLNDGVIATVGHEPEPFQNYYIEKILARIEETLASGGAIAWGTRFPGW